MTRQRGTTREQGAPHPPAAQGDETAAKPPQLHVLDENGRLHHMTRERFVIGRGHHCDLVVDSGKVSREHAALTRSGGEFWIEDLRSSNGTWFGSESVTRRKVENGDEYVLGRYRIRCVVR